MLLTPGHKLGPYEIVAPLGAGGMGEVYRARDTRLGRDVAVKILPKEVSADSARKQRFEREAKMISSLNHPNICTLHDIGSQDAVDFLVMECVEGETLAKRLEKGPLPLEQALKYGAQIADALDKAHRKGVMHRDLKPGNIMLTPLGAKLLDFGLAKPVAQPASAATFTALATQDSPVTERGTILGTFQYMSPEQVEGKELDARSDIFSLGAVLYEMVTGKRAFEGKSQLSVASSILEREPEPICTIKPLAPVALDHTIHRCLAKEPDQRWQSAADLKEELEWIANRGATAAGSQSAAPIRARKALRVYSALATVVALVLAGIVWRQSARVPATPSAVRFSLLLPSSDPIAVATYGPALAFAPDGKRVVCVVRHGDSNQLFLRDLSAFEGKLLSGTEGAGQPFFSPDGLWIGFYAEGKLKKISVEGGPAIALSEAPEGNGATWLPDDTLVFSVNWAEGLRRMSASGGTLQVVTRPDSLRGEAFHWWPDALPGGEAVLFTDQRGPGSDESSIAALSLRSGQWHTVLEKGSNSHYLAAGRMVLYLNGGTLWAAPFDIKTLKVTGPSFAALEGFLVEPHTSAAHVALSREGSVAFVPGTMTGLQNSLVKVDRTGHEQLITDLRRGYEDLSLSPDGQFLATTIMGETWNIWLYDLERGTLSRLTFEGDNRDPIWTADSKRIIYVSSRNGRFGLYWKPISGNGPEENLVATDSQPWPTSCSKDGRSLIFDLGPTTQARGIYLLPLSGERKPSAVVAEHFAQAAAISPNGKWIAYESSESGRTEIYVRQFPSGPTKWQISTDGGVRPKWSPNGDELFFRRGGLRSESTLISVAIRTEPSFIASRPKELFPFRYAQAGHDYAVMSDGQHFICIKESDPGSTQINVITNWMAELKKK